MLVMGELSKFYSLQGLCSGLHYSTTNDTGVFIYIPLGAFCMFFFCELFVQTFCQSFIGLFVVYK